MTVTLGILALLEARPGKGGELAAFLKAGRELAVAEEGTVTWYAFQISDTSYGIFDSFATDDGPDRAHQRADPGRAGRRVGRSAGQRTRHPARRRPGRQVTDRPGAGLGGPVLRLPARDRANPGSASLRIIREMSGKCRCPDRSSQRLSARPAGAGGRA